MLRPENARQKAALMRAIDKFEAAYEGSPAEEYMHGRGIMPRTAQAHRVGFVDPARPLEGFERFAGRICIPYLNVNKEPVWAKFRANPLVREFKAKYAQQEGGRGRLFNLPALNHPGDRSEEHTSELQSRENLVCRLLLRRPPRPPLFPYTTLFRSRPLEGFERFAGRICIPYLNVNKEPVWAKFRANPLVREFKAKYAQQEGGRGRLFNLPALNHPGD